MNKTTHMARLLSLVLVLTCAGCSSRESQVAQARYEWGFRMQGLGIGTTLPCGGPTEDEIKYYMSMGVVTLDELKILGYRK